MNKQNIKIIKGTEHPEEFNPDCKELDKAMLTPEEIVKREVARQAEFGMEPSWQDFVIAGIEETSPIIAEKIFREIEEYVKKYGRHCVAPEDWQGDWMLPWQALKAKYLRDIKL